MNAPTGICTEDEEGGWVDDLGQEKKKRKKNTLEVLLSVSHSRKWDGL